MTKKPYRVVYQYPGQKPGRVAHLRLVDAENLGGEIGRRGGDVTLLLVGDDGERVLARFGPDVLHRWQSVERGAYVCACGMTVTCEAAGWPADDADRHMGAAGLCRACEGTTLVPERATRDGGEPMAGNLIACPICQGTGLDADVSYWDVDLSAFYTRLEALRLKAGLPVTSKEES